MIKVPEGTYQRLLRVFAGPRSLLLLVFPIPIAAVIAVPICVSAHAGLDAVWIGSAATIGAAAGVVLHALWSLTPAWYPLVRVLCPRCRGACKHAVSEMDVDGLRSRLSVRPRCDRCGWSGQTTRVDHYWPLGRWEPV